MDLNTEIDFSFKNRVKFGKGRFKDLSDYLKEFRFSKPGIVVDGNLYENSELVQQVVDEVINQFGTFLHVYNYDFEPSYQYLDDIKSDFKTNGSPRFDCLVAIGGGSVMDTAKGLAILCTNEGDAIKYKGFPEDIRQPLPVICVPSTTGTGSELVYNASFVDLDTQVKMGINYRENYPVLAILDPLVVSTAPRSVLASSGCDALVHALESYVSVKSNDITRFFSKKAFDLIMNSLPELLDDLDNIELWSDMQWGAYFAMVGLSNSTSGPAGALSYYLGTHFKIPHGIAGGVFIGKITRYNHENGFTEGAGLYDSLKTETNGEQTLEEKSERVVKAVDQILQVAGIPDRLNELGVTEDDKKGFIDFYEGVQGAFDMNPVEMDRDAFDNFFNSLITST